MSAEKSTLAIEVVSTGIREASSALGGLSRAAGTTDKRVASLTANLAKLMGASGNLTGSVSGLTGSMSLINGALQAAAANAKMLADGIKNTTKGMDDMSNATTRATGALRDKAKWGGVVQTTLKAMTTAAMAYGGVNLLAHTVKSADGWMMLTAKLKLATGSITNARIAQQDLFDIAQKIRVPVEDMTKLFARLAPAMRNNGKSFEETKDMVEGVSLALQLNGATAGEASSVMLQFSQAMQKGRLDGAEFNAIAENGSLIMRALEKETGKNAGVLKKWGAEGKITFELIQRAMANHLEQWRRDFASLPLTVEGAWTRVKNAWFKASGEMSEQSGLNKGLTNLVAVLEKMIPVIRDELVGAFISVSEWIGRHKVGLGEVWDQIKGALGDVWRMATEFTSMSGHIADNGDAMSGFARIIFGARIGLAMTVDLLKVVGGVLAGLGTLVMAALAMPFLAVGKIVDAVVTRIRDIFKFVGDAANFVGLNSIGNAMISASDKATGLKDAMGSVNELVQDVIGNSAKLAKGWLLGGEKLELDKVLESEEKRLENERNLSEMRRERQRMDEKARRNFDLNAWKGTGPKSTPEPKKDKDAERAIKAANAELQQQIKLYMELDASLASLQKYGLEGDKRTKAQKEEVEIRLALGRATSEQAEQALEAALAYNLAAQVQERAEKGLRDMLVAEQDYAKSQDEKISKATEEAKGLEDKIAKYGMAIGAIEAYALAEAKAELTSMSWGGATDAQIAKQQALVDALQRTQDAKNTLAGLDAGAELDKLLDPGRAINFGNELGNAFGKAGKALSTLTKGLAEYDKRSMKIEHIRKVAEQSKLTDGKKYGAAMAEIANLETRSRLESYADMTGAAKQFFKEGSTGYKVLETAERGFRAVETALAIESFLLKNNLINESLLATLAADAKMVWSAITSGAQEIAVKMGIAQANAVAGVSNQANGDPYSAFARMAVMAAIMAGLGLAVGGGGSGGAKGPPLHEERQKKNGTGTILGDDQAKSESITKALERMRDNSNIGLVYTSEMLVSLRNIDLKMGGLTASIARATGMTTGLNFGVKEGSSGGGWFSSKKTTSIDDTGLSINGRLDSLNMQQYLDVTKTKSSWWGGTKSSSSREMQGVDGGLSTFVDGIFKDITNTIVAAGTSLGVSADGMRERLNAFVLSAEISLKDLRGEDLEKALQAFFSASADQLAQFAAGQFGMFQRAGEGYFETLTRVATGVERAKDAMSRLGVEMIHLNDVANKTGEVDVELVRESIMRQEAGTTMANIMRLLDGSMEDLISNYRELTRIRNVMQGMGFNANTLSLDLIRGAGGIRELSSAFDSYTENFFTQEEQVAMKMNQLTMEFGRLGVAVPQNRAAFKSLVTQLMQAGPMGQELAGRILSLSETFSEAMEMYDDTTGERITNARDALREAYDAESEALENTREKMQEFADSLKEFKDSLIMSEMSPLSIMEKYQTALSRYEETSTKALAGDEAAIADFQNIASELLRYSQEVNASGTTYLSDFNRVLAATQLLESYTQGQADQATTELDALKQQVDALISIEESVKTVAEAIVELLAVMGGGTAAASATNAVAAGLNDETAAILPTSPLPVTTQSVATTQAATVTYANDALVTELKALRTEVNALREEQKVQAGTQVNATYDATDRAADKVVDGVMAASETVNWNQQAPVGIA